MFAQLQVRGKLPLLPLLRAGDAPWPGLLGLLACFFLPPCCCTAEAHPAAL